MPLSTHLASADAALPFRTRYRREMNCQLVHDSIHERAGWSQTYLLSIDEQAVGWGLVAVAGPWKDKPTILEFYMVPEHGNRLFDLFEAFLAASGARRMEIQSNDPLLATLLHAYARDIWSEKIVFRDGLATQLPANGAVLHCTTPEAETRRSIAERQGGPEWSLEVAGRTVATGGILFHYNAPFGDLYMEVAEPDRRRGYGSFLVQELKRAAHDLGCRPGARCSPENLASRKTLQKAGMVPYAHMLNGTIRS